MLRNVFIVLAGMALVSIIWIGLSSTPTNKHVCEDVYCRIPLGMLESELPVLLGRPSQVVMGEPRRLETAIGSRTIIYDAADAIYQVKIYTNGDEQIAVAASGGKVLATEYRVCLHSVYYRGPNARRYAGATTAAIARPERAKAIEQRIANLLHDNLPVSEVQTPAQPGPESPTMPQDEMARQKLADLGDKYQAIVSETTAQATRQPPAAGPDLVWFNNWLNQVAEFESYAMASEITEESVKAKCRQIGLPDSYCEKWVRFIAAKSVAQQAVKKCGSSILDADLQRIGNWQDVAPAYQQNIGSLREQVAEKLRAILGCDAEERYANFAKLDVGVQEKLVKLCAKERLTDEELQFVAGHAGISPVLDAARESRRQAATTVDVSLAPRKPTRTWTSTGGHTVKAKFVSRFGDAIKIQTEDGRTVTVNVDQLSEADQQYLKSLAKWR